MENFKFFGGLIGGLILISAPFFAFLYELAKLQAR